jgi:hypothetical protein
MWAQRTLVFFFFASFLGSSAHAQTATLRDRLPHLSKKELLNVKARQGWSVQIDLPTGWKINEKAPSWMALFEKRGSGEYQLLREFKRQNLESLHVELPPIETRYSYRLQGTFYFCKEGGSCHVESRDLEIHTNDDSKSIDRIRIELK